MSLRAKCRWPFVLALFVAVQVTACSLVAAAWPGGGVGYPNTMLFDRWNARTGGSTNSPVSLGDPSTAGATLQLNNSDVTLSRTSNAWKLYAALATPGEFWVQNVKQFTMGPSNTLTAQAAASMTIQGANNQDIHITQQGTAKNIIDFSTGDGAGSLVPRLSIDSDKIKVTTSPGTSTGVLVGADSGALDLKANAAGGGEIKLLSGGNLTIGASGSQFSTLLNGSGSLTPGSIAAGGQFTQGVTVTGVAVGDACFVGTPAAGGGPDITASCFASASGTATVKLQNGNSAAQTGTTGTYNCWCIH